MALDMKICRTSLCKKVANVANTLKNKEVVNISDQIYFLIYSIMPPLPPN